MLDLVRCMGVCVQKDVQKDVHLASLTHVVTHNVNDQSSQKVLAARG